MAEETTNSELEYLLSLSLSLAAKGHWDEALASLEKAALIDPEDTRISSYRTSISDLRALDEVQNAWVDGVSSTVQQEVRESENDMDEEMPKFVIERDENGTRHDPDQFRNQLRGQFAFKLFVIDPITKDFINPWTSLEAFLYSSLAIDLRYWFPFLGRSFGINFRSSGYSWKPVLPTRLFNTLDFGINLMGFLLENKKSRFEIGLDFGASLHSTKNLTSQLINHNVALYLGLWANDPIFYHLFKADSLENLVIGGGVRIYTTTGEELIETVYYRVDGSWHFKNIQVGVLVEWWDFIESGVRETTTSFSIFSGIRF